MYHNPLELPQVSKVGVSFPWEVKPVEYVDQKLLMCLKLRLLARRIPVNVVLRSNVSLAKLGAPGFCSHG